MDHPPPPPCSSSGALSTSSSTSTSTSAMLSTVAAFVAAIGVSGLCGWMLGVAQRNDNNSNSKTANADVNASAVSSSSSSTTTTTTTTTTDDDGAPRSPFLALDDQLIAYLAHYANNSPSQSSASPIGWPTSMPIATPLPPPPFSATFRNLPLHSAEVHAALASIPLGESLRHACFLLNSRYTPLNHGSYGAVPACVLTHQWRLLAHVEELPDRWFRYESYERVREAVQPFAPYLGTSADNLVFVSNATSAVNAVLLSIDLRAGDVIVTPQLTYNACKLAMQAVCARTNATYVEIDIELPIRSVEHVLEQVRATFDRVANIKFALFDVITSPSSCVLPFAQLAQLCHDRHILCMLDGAHSLAQVPLQLDAIRGCDFWTGNCHKWAYAPKGTALLYAHPRHHATLHPVITSHFLRDPDWKRRFWMQATRDDASYVAAASGLHFLQAVGEKRAHDYMSSLADWAEEMLARELGTYTYASASESDHASSSTSSPGGPVAPHGLFPRSMSSPFMRLVRLPFTYPVGTPFAARQKYLDELMLRWSVQHQTVAVVVDIAGVLYLRISCQVYNTRYDYEVIMRLLRREWMARRRDVDV